MFKKLGPGQFRLKFWSECRRQPVTLSRDKNEKKTGQKNLDLRVAAS